MCTTNPLPTFDVRGFGIPAECNVQTDADGIVASLPELMGEGGM